MIIACKHELIWRNILNAKSFSSTRSAWPKQPLHRSWATLCTCVHVWLYHYVLYTTLSLWSSFKHTLQVHEVYRQVSIYRSKELGNSLSLLKASCCWMFKQSSKSPERKTEKNRSSFESVPSPSWSSRWEWSVIHLSSIISSFSEDRLAQLKLIEEECESKMQSLQDELAKIENLLTTAYDRWAYQGTQHNHSFHSPSPSLPPSLPPSRYLTDYLPSPATIPITVKLSVPEKQFVAENVILKPTDRYGLSVINTAL